MRLPRVLRARAGGGAWESARCCEREAATHLQVHMSRAVVCGRVGARRGQRVPFSAQSPTALALLCYPGRQPCAWRRELSDGTWVGGTGGRWGVSPCLPLATLPPHGFFRVVSLAELTRNLLLADICNTMLSTAEIPILMPYLVL